MEQMLEIREKIIKFSKKYENIILFGVKFLVGMVLFGLVHNIGYAREEFLFLSSGFLSFAILIMLGLLTTILPTTALFALLAVDVAAQFSLSLEMSVLVFLLLLSVVFLYVRMAPKESLLILAVLVGFYFKMPYAAPIFAGLYMGLTSIVPIIVGVSLWGCSMAALFTMNQMEFQTEMDFMAIPSVLSEIYQAFYSYFMDHNGWMYLAFLFAMVVLAVYLIAKLSIDYAKEIAVLVGGFMCLMGGIVGKIVTEIQFGYFTIIIFTLVSTLLILGVRFFDVVLDYPRAETVEFSDEQNYYYVKVIPKVITARKKKKMRQRPTQPEVDEW